MSHLTAGNSKQDRVAEINQKKPPKSHIWLTKPEIALFVAGSRPLVSSLAPHFPLGAGAKRRKGVTYAAKTAPG